MAIQGKLGRYRVLSFFIALWLTALLGLFSIEGSFLDNAIQSYISQPVNFILRHKLGQTPDISERLKILALDDTAVSELGDNELSLEQMIQLLENLDRRKPKAIILNRLLTQKVKQEGGRVLLDRLAKIQSPIYTGMYFGASKRVSRNEMELDEPIYQIGHYIDSAEPLVLPSLKEEKGTPYGYDLAFKGAIDGTGYMGINDNGSIYPMLRYKAAQVVPYLGLYAADNIKLRDGAIWVNEHPLPMNQDFESHLNYRPTPQYYKSTRSLKFALQRAAAGKEEKSVQEGDIVLLLFNFYTGGTRFFEGSPFGGLPTGFMMATVIDSVLQSRWIRQVGEGPIPLITVCIVGGLLGIKLGPIIFWLVSLGSSLVLFLSSIYLFSFHDILLPWFLLILAYLLSGLIFYVYQRLGSEMMKIQIEKDYYSEKSLRLEEENKKIKLEERLNLGKAVQEILLPERMEYTFADYHVAMKYKSAQEMSGDWLYVWDVDRHEQRIILGDVVGKGPSAAIPVAVIIGVLGECHRQQLSLEEALLRVNIRLLEQFRGQITSSCAAVSMRAEGLTVYNSGSPGWFIFQSGKGRYQPLRSSSLGLNQKLKVASLTLTHQESFLAFTFTDGYMEGSRAFRRLMSHLESKGEAVNAKDVEDALLKIGEGFRLEDDQSLLVVQQGIGIK